MTLVSDFSVLHEVLPRQGIARKRRAMTAVSYVSAYGRRPAIYAFAAKKADGYYGI